jgi:hypothetical protein
MVPIVVAPPAAHRIPVALAMIVALASPGCASSDGAPADPDCVGCEDASSETDGLPAASDAPFDVRPQESGTSASEAPDAPTDVNLWDGREDVWDASSIDASSTDADSGAGGDAEGAVDSGQAHDASEAGTGSDAGEAGADASWLDAKTEESGPGVITGGPCLSAAPGATAYRVHWVNAAGRAQVEYEVTGLPDTSRYRAGAYGYGMGFTPQYVDPYLGPGGLLLDSSDFVDIELSTTGVASIASATLSIYGRSYDTTTNGSFNWMTLDGSGGTPDDFVSNVPPYDWYSTDFTGGISPGDGTLLVRIKAGLSSGALVVNRIEICVEAN